MLAVLLSAALGRALGAADFGLLFLVSSMAQFAFVVVEWGQPQYVVRQVAQAGQGSGELLGATLMLRVIGTVALTAATVVTTWAFGYDLRTRGLAALLMACMLPFVLAQAFTLIFRGRERMEYESLTAVVNKGFTLGFTLIALSMGLGLEGAFIAQGIAGLLALLAAALFFRRLEDTSLQFRRRAAIKVLMGGTPLVIMSVAIASQSYIEAVVLSKLGSAESTGWFGAAKVILGTLIAPATILGSSAYPRLSRAASDLRTFRTELHVAIRPLMAVAVLGSVGTYLFAAEAVRFIYGEGDFGPAATVLQVFAPGLLLLFLDILLGTGVLAIGRSVPLAIGKVVTIGAHTTLAVLLVPYCQERFANGGIGIAIAFCLSELIMFLTAIWLLPRSSIQLVSILDCGRALIAGGITLGLFLMLPSLPLVIGGPLCVAVFGIASVMTGIIRKAELEHIRMKLLGR